MTRRTRGREIALQVLYQLEQNPDMPPEDVRVFIEGRLREPELRAYADSLVIGVRKHQAELDALLGGVAENWSVPRMAAIDRNILRLGAYELMHATEVPMKVVITEALELAKRYSTAASGRFVNGILDRLQNAAADARATAALEKEHRSQTDDRAETNGPIEPEPPEEA